MIVEVMQSLELIYTQKFQEAGMSMVMQNLIMSKILV